MRKDQVRIGAVCRMRLGSGTEIDVEIKRRLIRGWVVTSLRSGREYKVRDPKVLRMEVIPPDYVKDFKSRAAGERDEPQTND